MSSPFPAMKPRQLLKVLARLGYGEGSRDAGGSHRWLEAPGRPRLLWAFHESVTSIGPVVVRRILVKEVGLTQEEALEVIRRG
ncbi:MULTISPECIES: type II toxin-antitoxin system HicA family toxin [unclassified Frankia]|uniref:type II toxin-antitoxin system HicA family toxin n=1 Tax=unclassified Frankia TaxID=2632575 RepID=UPI002AD2FBB6|nr:MULTISPECIES: type II toxin-antitoxin system HicA family toxin [unclassified Frankia]